MDSEKLYLIKLIYSEVFHANSALQESHGIFSLTEKKKVLISPT